MTTLFIQYPLILKGGDVSSWPGANPGPTAVADGRRIRWLDEYHGNGRPLENVLCDGE